MSLSKSAKAVVDSRRAPAVQLCKIAQGRVDQKLGQFGREIVGPVAYRALVAEAIMGVIAGQDESAQAETIRYLVNVAWDWLNEELPS